MKQQRTDDLWFNWLAAHSSEEGIKEATKALGQEERTQRDGAVTSSTRYTNSEGVVVEENPGVIQENWMNLKNAVGGL